jgi:ubiquinone/menaquinone biosynthesis C-methylase UbiE
VLEVGFGSGLTLQRAAARVPQGWAAGIDRSPTMLDIARGRNAAAIASGRVELKLGEMTALPYAGNCFDKAYAVQVINYVPDLLLGLQELCRVLRPGGRAALFFEPKDKFERAKALIDGIYTPYAADEVVSLLRQTGFARAWSETTILSRRPVQTEGICALGEKALS